MKKFFISLIIIQFSLIGAIGNAGIPHEFFAAETIADIHAELVISDEEVELALLGKRQGHYHPKGAPCEGRISSGFGIRRFRGRKKMHKGLDIAAPIGTPIHAPAAGQVVFSGRKKGYGKTVIIEHNGELTTLFGHNSKIMVEEGDQVKKGDLISLVGNTGRSSGPHLHYEVRLNDMQVDPSQYI